MSTVETTSCQVAESTSPSVSAGESPVSPGVAAIPTTATSSIKVTTSRTPAGGKSPTLSGAAVGPEAFSQQGSTDGANSGSNSSCGNSPLPVPLICPRYQKKTRTKNAMQVTDSTSSEENTFSATELLRQRSVEALSIKHGCANYDEHVRFHAYALYKHGSRAIVTQSIGYSSDGDLVLQRQDVADGSDSDMNVKRVHSEVGGAVCLDPRARRPLTDTEEQSKRKINASKLKKYPGVKCPKNKKIRNRLMNDHFANSAARGVYDAVVAQEDDEDTDDDDDMGAQTNSFGGTPSFSAVPMDLHNDLVHVDEDRQFERLEKKGISPMLSGAAVAANQALLDSDPNGPVVRYALLSAKLKDELKRALGSEVLTQMIRELENKFHAFIVRAANDELGNNNDDDIEEEKESANKEEQEDDGEAVSTQTAKPSYENRKLTIEGLDGYGRLICHGVATYYKLISASEDALDGSRVIGITFPKKASAVTFLPPLCTLLDHLQRSSNKKKKGGSKGKGSGAAPGEGPAEIPPALSLGANMGERNHTRRKNKKRR